MVDMPTAPGPSPGSAAPITIEVNIHGAPTGDAKAFAGPAMQAMLTHAVRDAITSGGLAPV